MGTTTAKPRSGPEQPRTGRPMKTARKGRRYQSGVIVTGETKTIITEGAKASGRTISREVEHLISRALQYEEALARSHRTLEEIESDNIAAVLLRLGYTPTCPLNKESGKPYAKEGGGYWRVWAEPGYPGISLELSGFEPLTEEEREAVRARLQAPAREEPK